MSTTPDASFAPGSAVFDRWSADVRTGTPPTLYPVGRGDLAAVEVGPGRVLLLGGAPNAGKTVLACQMAFDALRLNPGLRAVVANVEMSPDALLDRQLARLARVDATAVRKRALIDAQRAAVSGGLDALRPLLDRLAFASAPFTLENVCLTADRTAADLILIDYIQRVAPPGDHRDKRAATDATMGLIRQVADAGRAFVVVAAVGRSKDQKGRNSYAADALSLASFRESSELEYGADDAYILCPAKDRGDLATLRHLKSRYGRTQDIPLAFNASTLEFLPSAFKVPA